MRVTTLPDAGLMLALAGVQPFSPCLLLPLGLASTPVYRLTFPGTPPHWAVVVEIW